MPKAAIRTRGQIITQGLEIGGRGVAGKPKARIFLAELEDFLYRSYEWPFSQTVASLTSTAGSELVSISSLADFDGRINKVRIAGSERPLIEMRYDEAVDAVEFSKEVGGLGIPTHFAVDPGLLNLLLYPLPQEGKAVKLLYYKVPTIPDPSDATTFDASTPDLPYAKVLTDAVAAFSKLWDQESLVVLQESLFQKALTQAKANIKHVGRAKATTFKINPNRWFFPRIDR